MGGAQSVRSAQFQHPNKPSTGALQDESPEEHHISISTKMVERLVEDATLAGGAAAATNVVTAPRGDYKEKFLIEKLKALDEKHSEKNGLTYEDITTMAARIEARTATMVGAGPVCRDMKQLVIQCYSDSSEAGDVIKCWDTVDNFKKCVEDVGAARLNARTQREARQHARRERHVAHAREHALRDLASPEPTPS